MTHPYFLGSPTPRVFAHRGLASTNSEGPAVWENTAGAFAAAHAAGATYIETDCQVTADGDVVLFHDDSLTRLLGDPRRVGDVSTRELANLLAPYGGLLSVSEALAAFPTVRFNIDVKSDAAVEPIGRQIAAHTDRVLLTSFSDDRRRRAVDATLHAGAALRPATSAGQATIIRLRLATALHLSPARILRDIDAIQIPERVGPLRIATRALVRAVQKIGVEVHVWTVNDSADMHRLVALGVDGIVTDHADVALREISAP